MLCWHRLRIRRKLFLCKYCGVLIEECPCVTWRLVDDNCPCCSGSGWVAAVRGSVAKFKEYVDNQI